MTICLLYPMKIVSLESNFTTLLGLSDNKVGQTSVALCSMNDLDFLTTGKTQICY